MRRPVPGLVGLLAATSLAGGSLVLPADGWAKPGSAAAARAMGSGSSASLTLKSKVRKRVRRAQAAGAVLPFTIRLRRSYEGGPGDDVVALSWDPSASPWPLAGTAPVAGSATTSLDGAFTSQWDFGADTSGYATRGTVETHVGAGVALTGSGFGIAAPEGATCTTWAALDATGIALTSAGARFGSANPFSGEVSGTLSLRTAIRTRAVPCGGDPATAATAVARTADADPPLPVAFSGRLTISPAVTADGRVRLGVLRIADTPATPQRSTFGLLHACADPAAADGCDRRAFPVRTRLVSLTAEVLAGDAMPAAPGDPAEPAPAAPPAPAPGGAEGAR
jgi:hypothetical protein